MQKIDIVLEANNVLLVVCQIWSWLMIETLARMQREPNLDAQRYRVIWVDKENDQGFWSWV